VKPVLSLLLLFFPSLALAQNGNSVLSRFGVGDLDNLATVAQRAMGYVSQPVFSGYDISLSNPASWTHIDKLRLNGAMSWEHESSSRSSDLNTASLGFKTLQLALPLDEDWRSRLVLGLQSYSTVNYDLLASGAVESHRYTAEYSGAGGLAYAVLGAALRLVPSLNIGAAARWYFGTIDHSWDVRFDDDAYYDTRQQRSTSHGGIGFLFGLLYTGIDGFAIGASVSPNSTLDAARDYVFRYSTHDSTVRASESVQDIPLRYQAGLSWRAGERLLLAADVCAQDWTEARVFGLKQPERTSSYRVGVGAEWMPGGADDAPAARNMLLRFGLARQKLPMLLQGEEQNETYLTAGAGFPIFGDSRADASVEAGLRGNSDQLLGSRFIMRLSLNISVGEGWFLRRDLD